MKKVSISIVFLGNTSDSLNIGILSRWKSKLFTIAKLTSIENIPNANGMSWEYTKDQLKEIIKPDIDCDCTMGIINAPLEGNYYMRRLGNNIAVISLFQMADILAKSNFRIETYIIRNIYEGLALYYGNNYSIPESSYSWAHDDIRGCLFDMNAHKPNIIYSMNKPILCTSCKARMLQQKVELGVVKEIEKELPRIQKERLFVIIDWIRKHVVISFIITIILGGTINVISNGIYDLLKQIVINYYKK
jgi:hypothetical protein